MKTLDRTESGYTPVDWGDLILPSKTRVFGEYVDLRDIHDFGVNSNKQNRKPKKQEPTAQELIDGD